jgi:deazaflavin-dependent oxidoreductase (nitroreductase family)
MANRAQTQKDRLDTEPFLYLTTIGRVTGQPRMIEIWFIFDQGKFYVLSERFHESQWVKNIEREPHVRVRIKDREVPARARILSPASDGKIWNRVQQLSRQKYGWGEGLVVELVPMEAQ